MSTATAFLQLPSEILINILEFQTHFELAHFKLVNKTCRSLASLNYLWYSLYKRATFPTPVKLEATNGDALPLPQVPASVIVPLRPEILAIAADVLHSLEQEKEDEETGGGKSPNSRIAKEMKSEKWEHIVAQLSNLPRPRFGWFMDDFLNDYHGPCHLHLAATDQTYSHIRLVHQAEQSQRCAEGGITWVPERGLCHFDQTDKPEHTELLHLYTRLPEANTDSLSMALWIRASAPCVMFEKDTAGAARFYWIDYEADSEWHLVGCVMEKYERGVSWFMDGKFVYCDLNDSGEPGTTLQCWAGQGFLKIGQADAEWYSGDMAQYQVWHHKLTQEHFAALYKWGAPRSWLYKEPQPQDPKPEQEAEGEAAESPFDLQEETEDQEAEDAQEQGEDEEQHA